MRLRTVPARLGFVWVRRGFQAFLQRPLANTFLLVGFAVAALCLLLFVPFVGAVMVIMSMPLLSLGFMIATRSALAGLPTYGPGVLIAGLRGPAPQRRSMWWLLAIFAVANIAVALIAGAVDAGRLDAVRNAMMADPAPSQDEMAVLMGDPRLVWGMLIRIGLTLLVSLPFWHAPALIFWEGQGVGQALFISSLACWRNKGALTTFGLGWTALGMLFLMIASTLGDPRVIAVTAMPAMLMFTTAFYASLYFIYADCFQPEAPVAREIPLPPAPPATP